MRGLVRVDASTTIGNGHLARTLTLARALARQGFAMTFATHDPSASTRAWIAREGHAVHTLGAERDREEASRAAEGAALVVIDSYRFDRAYHDALRVPDRVVCVIDDLCDAPIGGDAILNGNLYGDTLPYPADRTLLVGPSFALVRDEIVAARAVPRIAHDGPPRLLVTMGGADPTGETTKVLSALSRIEAPLDVHIVVGGANPHADIVRLGAQRLAQHHMTVLVDIATMGAEMAWADLAITASGGTCLELTCVGVPSIVIEVADNQRLVSKALRDRDLMTVLGKSMEVDARAITTALEDLLAARDRWPELVARQRTVVDGGGADRTAERLHALSAA